MFDFERPVERPLHPAALTDEDLLAQCDLIRSRSGGPGGQRRNKVEAGVELVHRPTGLRAAASERRSATENQRVALRRLRLELAMHVRVGVPVGDIRSDLWKSRVRNRRIICSVRHRDFPAMLAEARDVIEAAELDTAKAATRLECTPSQLHKLIQGHPPAWTDLNRRRESRGMRVLK